MAAGGPELARRKFVKVLVMLAALYSLRLDLNRDSSDEALKKAFRRTALEAHAAHADKGGNKQTKPRTRAQRTPTGKKQETHNTNLATICDPECCDYLLI